MREEATMLERLDGRIWHGDHLIDAATPQEIARLAALEDGTGTDGPLVHRVREFSTELDGAVLIHSFDIKDPQQAPAGQPLGHLGAGPSLAAPRSTPATVRVVSLEAPERLGEADRMRMELLLESGVVLTMVSWGEVSKWVPASTTRGAPATTVEQAFLLALAPAERVVPSIDAARAWLAESDALPGGERGQRLRENGRKWASVPTTDSWEAQAADPWIVGGLLGLATDPLNQDRSTKLGAPIPQLRPIVPGGAPVVLASASGGLLTRTNDQLLTLWEGKDEEDGTVAVAVHRSEAEMPRLELPLWPGQRQADPPDGWCGEVMEYEDDPGYVERTRLKVTPSGRLAFPSRRIVTSDPCVGGRSPALGLALESEGPFPVLRADLVSVMDEGRELDDQARGILLVIDEVHAPVRWEPARDEEGEPIDVVIDTGQLLLGDAVGSREIQRQYDEGTVNYGAQSRLTLLRSDPVQPADMAVLADLGGDGPAWVVIGVSEDERPVAVLVANFDPLS
jgi:hypothetical protein